MGHRVKHTGKCYTRPSPCSLTIVAQWNCRFYPAANTALELTIDILTLQSPNKWNFYVSQKTNYFVAIKCVLWSWKCTKAAFGRRSSAPDPAWRSYNAPSDPLVGWRRDNPSPFPRQSPSTTLSTSRFLPTQWKKSFPCRLRSWPKLMCHMVLIIILLFLQTLLGHNITITFSSSAAVTAWYLNQRCRI